jgi:TPR repeat protein
MWTAAGGCAPGAAGDGLRPDQPTAAAALGEEEPPIRGEPTPNDEPSGLALLERACDAGRWQDCERMAAVLRAGKEVPKDTLGALQAYDRACGFGGLRACNEVGTMLAEGEDVPQDLGRALSYFQTACPDQGAFGWDACASLAALYDEGKGVTQDRARAASLYVKAGKTLLAGKMYEQGTGVAKDLDQAIAAYDQGCRKFSSGDSQANCDAMGRLLEQSDKERARKHYKELCQRMRHEPSCTKAIQLGAQPNSSP